MSGFIIPTKRNLRKRGRSMSPRTSVGGKKSAEISSSSSLTSHSSSFHETEEIESESVLVIGASGRTGSACIQRLAQTEGETTRIHAFCRNPSKLSESHKKLCTSVITGDARNPQYLEAALEVTKATAVLLAVGDEDDQCHHKDAAIRTESAQALVRVLHTAHSHVRVIAVSDATGEPSWAHRFFPNQGQHTAKDCAGQEQALLHQNSVVAQQWTVVRASHITDQEGDRNSSVIQVLGNDDTNSSAPVHRSDLVDWLVQQVLFAGRYQGQAVTLTSVKTQPSHPFPLPLRASLSLWSSSPPPPPPPTHNKTIVPVQH